MKQFFILLFTFLVWLPTQAQAPCTDYASLLKEANDFLNAENYGKAIRLFQAAKVCNPKAGEMIDEKIIEVFNQIEKQREQAIKDRNNAKKAKEEVLIALNKVEEEKKRVVDEKEKADVERKNAEMAKQQAMIEKQNAESIQARAEADNKTALADNIAYKAGQLLEDGFRSEAFNLAAFAHYFIERNNHNVSQVLSDAFYCNWKKERITDNKRLNWSRTLQGHSSEILAVAFSPEGRTVLTGSEDKTAKLWNIKTGEELQTFKSHTSVVNAVAFSPDGQTVLTGSGDGTAKLWDIGTGNELRTFKCDVTKNWENWGVGVWAVAFSPDGRTVLTGDNNGRIKLWDIGTGDELRNIDSYNSHVSAVNGVTKVAFSPEGRKVLSTSTEGVAKLWDIETGKKLRTYKKRNQYFFEGTFSQDGRTMWTAIYGEMEHVLRIRMGRKLHTLNELPEVLALAFSPDGQTVLTGDTDKMARLWDLKTGSELRTFAGHTAGVNTVAFSPGGQVALTGSADGTAKLWDIGITPAKTITSDVYTSKFSAIGFSPDGKVALTGSADGKAKLWDLSTGNELLTFKEQHTSKVSAVAFSPNGRMALTVSNDGRLKTWDIDTGERHNEFFAPRYVNTIAVSEQDQVLMRSDFGDVSLLDLHREQGAAGIYYERYPSSASAIALSKLSEEALIGDFDGTVKLWKWYEWGNEETSPLRGRHISAISAITTFLMDNYNEVVLMGSVDGMVKSTKSSQNLYQNEAVEISTIAVSPELMLLIGRADGKVDFMRNFSIDRSVRTFEGHSSRVTSVAFASDSVFYSGSDRIIRHICTTQQLLDEAPVFGYLPPSHIKSYGLLDLLSYYADTSVVRQTENHHMLGTLGSAFAQERYDPQWAEACFKQAYSLAGWEVYSNKLADLYLQWSKNLLQNGDKKKAYKKADLAYLLMPSFSTLLQLAECSGNVEAVLLSGLEKINESGVLEYVLKFNLESLKKWQ